MLIKAYHHRGTTGHLCMRCEVAATACHFGRWQRRSCSALVRRASPAEPGHAGGRVLGGGLSTRRPFRALTEPPPVTSSCNDGHACPPTARGVPPVTNRRVPRASSAHSPAAVVLGGGLTGMLAAAVLADHAEVQIVERDLLATAPRSPLPARACFKPSTHTCCGPAAPAPSKACYPASHSDGWRRAPAASLCPPGWCLSPRRAGCAGGPKCST